MRIGFSGFEPPSVEAQMLNEYQATHDQIVRRPDEDADNAMFLVIRSGDYTVKINGEDVTAHRVAVVGAYSTRSKAEQALRDMPDAFKGAERTGKWGVSATSIYRAVVDGPPIID